MKGERWREIRGSVRFRLREMERDWGVLDVSVYEEKGRALEVD